MRLSWSRAILQIPHNAHHHARHKGPRNHPHRHHSAASVADKTLCVRQIFYIAEFFYAACTVPIKGSICVCLVRIADARRRFVWSLWGLVALQTLAAIIFIITIGNICHPVTAMLGETAGVCNANLNSHISFFFSGVSILTDLMLAILPALLLWPIQMKRRLKFSVVIILGMAAL